MRRSRRADDRSATALALAAVLALGAGACTASASADGGSTAEPTVSTEAPAATGTGRPASTTTTAPRRTTTTGATVEAEVAPSTTAAPAPPTTAPPLGPGAVGPQVEALQARLAELGYSIGPVDGRYGGGTASAVMAFQKVEGLAVDGVPGPQTLGRLGAPTGSVPGPGPLRIEIDLARQVLFVVSESGTRIFNTSTGNNEPFTWSDGTPGLAYTPTGEFAVYYRVDGVDDGDLGEMYRPLYFHTDWAVHGSSYVPAYPASHGCARVSNADQDWIWDHVPMGTPVIVY